MQASKQASKARQLRVGRPIARPNSAYLISKEIQYSYYILIPIGFNRINFLSIELRLLAKQGKTVLTLLCCPYITGKRRTEYT